MYLNGKQKYQSWIAIWSMDLVLKFNTYTAIRNIYFQLSGGGILGAGIWLKVDPNSVNIQKLISVDSHDTAISSTAYVLIGFGGIVFLVGFLGCLGGIKQWKWALGMVGICLLFFLRVYFSNGFLDLTNISWLYLQNVRSHYLLVITN